METNLSANQWNQSLGFLIPKLHISFIVNSFKCLKSVKVLCLGSSLLPDYESTINEYKEVYVKLGLRVSSIMHALVKQTCKL